MTNAEEAIAALAVDAAAREYLAGRAALSRVGAQECRDYAALYAEIGAPDGPAGRSVARREDELLARMARRLDTEGRAEKGALAEFLALAEKAQADLAARYRLAFAPAR